MLGIPVALNVDGIERKRRKWNAFARAWYRASEYLSTILPNQFVTDAEAIREYYKQRYNRDSLFIPYGADTERVESKGALDALGLKPYQYFLYVSRLEPENRALEVRQAFERTSAAMKLALIGDAPHAHEYIDRVRNTKDGRIVMPGAIYGLGYGLANPSINLRATHLPSSNVAILCEILSSVTVKSEGRRLVT